MTSSHKLEYAYGLDNLKPEVTLNTNRTRRTDIIRISRYMSRFISWGMSKTSDILLSSVWCFTNNRGSALISARVMSEDVVSSSACTKV